ncbi:hypothetical protein L4X63_09395 [Geomonas sp. Red32]|uniref:hypothetical protein n=1 Tax=Geomonas sp. Red32 TaxID=2912856 RepID=UPI00202CB12C|nr:hypothetical protein [Geomonas sp. Red32]MCM0081803.1 hypothetical protein [Geomonas sp. Red32]
MSTLLHQAQSPFHPIFCFALAVGAFTAVAGWDNGAVDLKGESHLEHHHRLRRRFFWHCSAVIRAVRAWQ